MTSNLMKIPEEIKLKILEYVPDQTFLSQTCKTFAQICTPSPLGLSICIADRKSLDRVEMASKLPRLISRIQWLVFDVKQENNAEPGEDVYNPREDLAETAKTLRNFEAIKKITLPGANILTCGQNQYTAMLNLSILVARLVFNVISSCELGIEELILPEAQWLDFEPFSPTASNAITPSYGCLRRLCMDLAFAHSDALAPFGIAMFLRSAPQLKFLSFALGPFEEEQPWYMWDYYAHEMVWPHLEVLDLISDVSIPFLRSFFYKHPGIRRFTLGYHDQNLGLQDFLDLARGEEFHNVEIGGIFRVEDIVRQSVLICGGGMAVMHMAEDEIGTITRASSELSGAVDSWLEM